MIHTIAMYATAGRTLGVLNLDGHTISDDDIWPSTTTAKVVINTDGTVDQLTESGQSQIDSATDWIIPNVAATHISYEVRYTGLTGSAIQAPAAQGTWLELTSAQSFGLSHGSKIGQDSTFTVQIRPLSGGATLASGVYVVHAENFFS